jgi:hypothetical protein
MHILIVKFHSARSDEEVRRLMEERLPQFQAVPGLVQKYYAREAATGDHLGLYIFDSEQSLVQFRNSDLARSIPPVYQPLTAPRIEMLEMLFALRPVSDLTRA